MKIKKLLVLTLAAALSVAAAWAQDDDAVYATDLVKAGQKAPAFKVPDVSGKVLTLKDFKGKSLVLDFWATWCPDCRKDMPRMKALYEQARKSKKKIAFLGVSADTDKAALEAYVRENGIAWPQLYEGVKRNESVISADYHVKWIPSVYVIGPDGKVILSTVMIDKVEACLKEIF